MGGGYILKFKFKEGMEYGKESLKHMQYFQFISAKCQMYNITVGHQSLVMTDIEGPAY